MKRYRGGALAFATAMLVAPLVGATSAYAGHSLPFTTVSATPSQVISDVTISGTVAMGENVTRSLALALRDINSVLVSKSITVPATTADYSVPFSSAELSTLAEGAVQVTATATNRYGETRSASTCFYKGANPPPPAVVTQPVAPSNATSGQVFTLTSTAPGCPTPTVQWQSLPPNVPDAVFTNIPGATSTTLSVRPTYADSNTQYRAVFTNGSGSTMSNTVTVPVAPAVPAVTRNPVSQTVNSGSSVTFTSDATGDPTPTVQWERINTDGTTVVLDGATGKNLTLNSVTFTDNGAQFRAVYTNIGGSATTSSATLNVILFSPVVTQNPSDASVQAGDPVTFTAAATSEVAQTVQWQESVANGPFVDITGETSNDLVFTTSFSQDGNRYQTVFTNSAGRTTTTPAALTVSPLAPTVTSSPQDVAVNEGQPVTFSGSATGDPAPTGQFQLSTDGGVTFANIEGVTGNSFTIGAVTAAEDGNQFRIVYGNGVDPAATTAAAVLTVNTAPVVTGPADQAVADGDQAAFTVTSDDPAATVQWFVSTDGGAVYNAVPSATTETLTFTARLVDDGNRYYAVLTNNVGSRQSRTATLTVNANAPTITDQPDDITANSGDSATFTVAASSAPAATVRWQVSTDGVTFTDIAGEVSNTLTLSLVTFADSGNQYRAIFTNVVGPTTTNAATLTVNAIAPVLTSNPTSQTVVAGDSVTFSVEATGDPSPSVQWQVSTDGAFTDVAGATNRDYTLTTAAGDDGNVYRAAFTNPGGTATSRVALLTVNTVPQVTAEPVNQTVAEGETASFTVAADGRPAPTLQWQTSIDGTLFTDIAGAISGTHTTGPLTLADDGRTYRAVFTNAAGTATSRAADLTVTETPMPPAAPRDVTAEQTGPGTVTITWRAPTDQGTSPVTGYDVGYAAGSMGTGQTVSATTFSKTFTGLTDGTYQASVAAVSTAGAGERVFTPFVITTAAPTPTAPTPTEPTPTPAVSCSTAPVKFSDIAGNTHRSSILAVARANITCGYADGTYRPGVKVSRGQMASFLARALNLTPGDPRRFPDAAGSVHAGNIAAVADAGIAVGFLDGTYRADAPVTRAQMATFLKHAAQLPDGPSGTFPDIAGDVHERAIGAVFQAGIATGHTDGNYRPSNAVTRDQMATFLFRAFLR